MSCIFKIQIDKPINKTQLNKIAKKLIGKTYEIIERKKCYEIINLHRKYFKPKCYKKEKHDNVTIIVGELKNKHAKLHGGGFVSDIFNKVKNKIVDTFSVKLGFNNAANKI